MKTTTFGTRSMIKDCAGLITPLPGQTFFLSLIDEIAKTKLTLDIIQYQWNFYLNQPDNPVQKLNQTLLNKIRGGIKCRILLNKEGRGQHLTAINMKASRYLIEAGAVVKFGRTFPITHSKLWLIDDDLSFVGSHNLSGRSFTVNNEVSALINSRPVLMEYRRYFESIWDRL